MIGINKGGRDKDKYVFSYLGSNGKRHLYLLRWHPCNHCGDTPTLRLHKQVVHESTRTLQSDNRSHGNLYTRQGIRQTCASGHKSQVTTPPTFVRRQVLSRTPVVWWRRFSVVPGKTVLIAWPDNDLTGSLCASWCSRWTNKEGEREGESHKSKGNRRVFTCTCKFKCVHASCRARVHQLESVWMSLCGCLSVHCCWIIISPNSMCFYRGLTIANVCKTKPGWQNEKNKTKNL